MTKLVDVPVLADGQVLGFVVPEPLQRVGSSPTLPTN